MSNIKRLRNFPQTNLPQKIQYNSLPISFIPFVTSITYGFLLVKSKSKQVPV